MSARRISFEGMENHWNTALPLGNGKMGGMVFFEQKTLHIALNHYDCYYPVLPRYAKKKEMPAVDTYKDICARVDQARREPGYEYSHYNNILHPVLPGSRPSYSTTSYPMAGEILLPLTMDMDSHDFSLVLDTTKAIVEFHAKWKNKEAGARIWIAHKTDGLFIELMQSEEGLWGNAELIIPSVRGMGGYNINKGGESGIQWIRTSFKLEAELDPDNIITIETAVAASQNILAACVSRDSAVDRVRSLLEVGTLKEEGILKDAETLKEEGILKDTGMLKKVETLREEHSAFWKDFWRSRVELPDKFLETLWYLHVYLMGCASGLGSSYPEQACGLNGLWDIRRPSLWGSMWYWDVNIQEAFWPVFSINHPELGKLFCDGYVRYEKDILDFAQNVYDTKEWALDYPHMLYNCIQPWCAQFLWQYYSYSGDMDFLREKAYPVFQRQIHFFKEIAVLDEFGILHINYDISPEQGPVTRDSVITIATVRQLLKYAVKVARILERPKDEAEEYTRLLSILPEYATTGSGKRFRDSAYAPEDLFLRHPSVLMPIFPAEEIGRHSSGKMREIGENTLRYAIDHTEIGMFGFGWLACAAARLWTGEDVLRIIYERGLDYILHTNGLCYEESERFINYCLITKPPLYPPAMTEPSGGLVMAVNMMLMQSEDYIEVFPAVPADWHDIGFSGLMAPGGFVISAERAAGKTIWIQVTAEREGMLSLMLPENLNPSGKETVYQKDMLAGESISFGTPGEKGQDTVADQQGRAISNGVQTRQAAFTGRRIYLGENRHTAFHKAVDAFACPYLMGYTHRYPMTQYVFDFCDGSNAKDYDSVYHKEFYQAGRSQVFFGGPKPIGAFRYTEDTGYGFSSIKGLAIRDRGYPDDIRRDFVEGDEDNEFWMELPGGKYNLLVVSGDESSQSMTHLFFPAIHGRIMGEITAPGHYQCRMIPFVQERDGIFRLCLSTEEGHKWKLNAMFLNKEYAI